MRGRRSPRPFFVLLFTLLGQTDQAFGLVTKLFQIFSILIVPVLMVILFVLFFYGVMSSLFEPFSRKKNVVIMLAPALIISFTGYVESLVRLLFSMLWIFLVVLVPMVLILSIIKFFVKVIRA